MLHTLITIGSIVMLIGLIAFIWWEIYSRRARIREIMRTRIQPMEPTPEQRRRDRREMAWCAAIICGLVFFALVW